ncbi:TetR/AcrR family transcriptional regulator [Streptococcus mutans]|uniref:TetR/AcrR family transcriptional regulator n=1 Tax=Streptococcus mutans TaxID=1309 RepID=UPI0002B5D609|nr:TetR/AcrR family transcriptional regulator [Streptococcus mutans]EMB69478.1 putative transcriptional regulator [Streptococcus mutans 11SSST2]MCB4972130.1 TetR/AcrR family transcriptional regulator [Streptococcus mutans]MCB4973961.1 TetR/AcrR family transcriptional regulator [Streptococcus mutans]MCY7124580.1 TetR/AcrR family transcriptional regulator [Streptococcus mutans]MDT9501362.1 TetR/AcrR family transcriptional regulator [Streptococcus mutans]
MNNLTEQAFARALKEIMAKKSFDKVTVTELVRFLNVNRQTFYYHFKDLYDLLEWIYITDGEKMIGDKRTTASWQEGLLAIFQYIQDNEAFVRNTYHSINRNYLEHFLYDRAYSLIRPVIEENEVQTQLSEADIDLRAHFYKYGLVGFILDWIDSGLRENPEDLTQRIYHLLESL